jgi:hypothetical protein
MVRSVVVLPAPLRPSRTVMPPLGTTGPRLQDVVLADVGMHPFELQKHCQTWSAIPVPR